MDFLTTSFILKFLKFACVGLTGMAVDFGVTYLCKEIIKIQKYVSNAIGFAVAATSNYFLNRIWTFESHNPQIAIEYVMFFVISLIGLGINTVILWLLVSKLKWNFWFAKLIAIAVVMIWNFLMNLIFTFGGRIF